MFDFDGDHATLVRPPHKAAATPNNWAKDPSGPGANDGTRITASLINSIVGNLRHLLDAYNISLPGSSDDAVKLAIEAAIQQALKNHTFSVAELKDGDGYVRMTDAERAKLASLAANYKGAFADLAAVAVAYPAAAAGDWAIIMKPGEPAAVALWDADTEEWVESAGSPPQTASQVPFTPSGNLSATNVQAALEELDQKKQPAAANLYSWAGIAPASKADAASVDAALAARLRVDAYQGLSAAEVAQARKNLQLGTGPLGGFRNKIINGDGRINQRVVSTIGDDTYGHDRHYALTQTGNITVSTLTAPADGIASMMRLAQPSATAKRMGYAQIVEAIETYPLRGKTVTLGGKLRCSSATPIRFAILEWTGTPDQVTSDVVNNWNSTNYTPGNFFISSSLTVAAVGSITPGANTITDWNLTATISPSANNIIVFYWTQNTVAQNTTLDMRWYLVEGDATAEDDPFSPRHIQQELALCERYFERLGGDVGQEQFGAGTVRSPTTVEVLVNYSKKRASPTISLSNANTFRVVAGSGGVAVSSISAVERSLRVAAINATVSGSLTVGNGCFLQRQDGQVPHIYVDAEL